MNMLTHKGYCGSVEYSKEDDCLFGRVMFIRSLLTYEGQTLAELKADFEGVVDEYLADCKADGRTPESRSRALSM